MNRKTLDKRLQDLGIYNDYYMRKELKPLADLIADGVSLNCVLTGVHDANRKLVAVTDKEIIVIFAAALGGGEVKVISRSAVESFDFDKKLLRSTLCIKTADETLEFTGVQGARRDLFLWAMEQPLAE